MRAILTALTVGLLIAIGGCADYTTPVAPQRSMTPTERNFENVWETSLDTLQWCNFEIDRQDRRAGLILTKPIVGQQFFEFWRHDAVTAYNLTEDSLQTIYLKAQVTITPSKTQSDRYVAEVEVFKARTDRPHIEITNTSQAYQMFYMPGDNITRLRYTTIDELNEGVDAEGKPVSYFVPLGKDDALSNMLTRRINSRAHQQ